MKLSRTIWVTGDDNERISVNLTFNKHATLDSEQIKDNFETWIDDIYEIFRKRFHAFAIKMSQ